MSRMVQGEPEGDVAAAVVTGDREPGVTELLMSATTSAAIARLEACAWSGRGAGAVEPPYPRRSGQTTVWPAPTSNGATRCQVVCVRG